MLNFITNLVSITIIFLFGCTSSKSDTVAGGNDIVEADLDKLTSSCFVANTRNPILTRDSLLSGSDWNDPSVIKVGDQYVMYASSDQNFNFDISIYRLTSDDGISWALNPSNPVLQASAGAWDARAVETPSVVYFNQKFHMFYTGYPSTHKDSYSYKIGHAISDDGITWTKKSNYILAPNDPTNTTPNLTFNQWVVAEPAAVVFDNKIYLYFSAIGANLSVNTTLQVIGLTTSVDGESWTPAESVLTPDQGLYPRSTWMGYSTPNAVVLDQQMHLFFDVVQESPYKQLRIHHAKSTDGKLNWTHDNQPIFTVSLFPWSSNEIRSPSVLLDGTSLHMWFAGDEGTTLGIGHSICELN